jgi:hypothetical protein
MSLLLVAIKKIGFIYVKKIFAREIKKQTNLSYIVYGL